MKKTACVLLCIVMLGSLLVLPVSAAIFQVTYYTEEIYAGGVVDLYAFAENGGAAPFTYQWQAEGFGWIDLEDNDVYKGTKTNHLRLYTKPGTYSDFDSIPFQCAVTDAEGTTFYTPNIFMVIYPTDELIPDLKNWGYGLYEPTVTNVTGLYTSDYVNYTASTFAGTTMSLLCGSKSVDDYAILRNSEVELTREIHITENGHTTKVGDQTSYTPYTVGANAVTVEFKLHLTIGGYDLGDLDTKTVKISTSKPTAVSTATAKTDCSLLRYTYNESQKLASIPSGAAVEVLGKQGSYYQVFYNNYVGYVGTSLLNTQQSSYDPVIKEVDVTIGEPVAGQKPDYDCQVLTEGCQLYWVDPVTWTDKQTGKILSPQDTFQEGRSYNVSIWLSAKDGYKFQVDASYWPKLTGAINGDRPPFINKAYEQDPEEVIELTYTFNNVQPAPEESHTCTPVLVPRVEPTCTKTGFEAYYYCACGMCYKDSQGQTVVNTSQWGTIPATGHNYTEWRYNMAEHYKYCLNCGEMFFLAAHKGGTATCTAKPVCEVCGLAYGMTAPEHKWSPTYLYQDSTGHAWVCADCKAHSEIEPHIPGPAGTDDDPVVCRDCGYIITPAKNHTHKLTKVPQTPATCIQEGNIEYYTCDGCSDRFADSAGKQKIPETTSVGIGALGHTPSDSWSHDGEYHWRTCQKCKAVLGETKMLHEIENGTCVTCAYQKAAESTAQTKPKTEETSPAPGQEGTGPVLQTDPQTKPANAAQETPSPTQSIPGVPQKEKSGTSISLLAAVLMGAVSFSVAITATVIILKRKK